MRELKKIHRLRDKLEKLLSKYYGETICVIIARPGSKIVHEDGSVDYIGE